MTTDPTVRIVWFRGRAYPISNAPHQGEGGAMWRVYVDDRWEPLFAATEKEMDSSAWRELEGRVADWLEKRTA